jgi:putative DNA primase/helicase
MTLVQRVCLFFEYLKRGWPVFPVYDAPNGHCSCGKATCDRPGKHPRLEHGYLDATRSPGQVWRWWKQWPTANIGLVTGTCSCALDWDPKYGGDEALRELQAVHGPLPVTWHTLTGGGGGHYHFQPVPGLRNSTGILGPGLDIRAEGGFVVAPDSVHANGRPYIWEIGRSPADVPLAPMPKWMLERLTRPRQPAPAAIVDWAARLAGAPEGTRHDEAVRIAGHLAHHGLAAEEISQILMGFAALCRPPLRPDELGDFRRVAVDVWQREQAQRAQREQAQRAPHLDVSEHLTDLGNARQFVLANSGEVRYSTQLGWRVWNGRRWDPDNTGEVLRRVRHMISSRYHVLPTLDQAERPKFLAHLMRSEKRERVEAVARLAQSEPEIAVTPGDFDQNAWWLNVLNGTLDLRTSKLQDHRAENLLTRLAPITYDPKATAPRFTRFLDEILPNHELQRFVQRALGYSLTGMTQEQALFICHGTGANGKSSLLGAVSHVLGDYAAHARVETFLAKRYESGPTTDLAALVGARCVLTTEPDFGRWLAEGLLKDVTGGEPITCRFLYRDVFSYAPQFKLWLATNHRPRVRGTDLGLWRRIRLIPFEVTIKEEARDKKLLDQLKEESPGILRWLVEGCQAWQTEGLGTPEAVEKATGAYRHEQDVLGEFLAEECDVGDDCADTAAALYEAYSRWAIAAGEERLSKRGFGLLLGERGFRQDPSHKHGRRWRGLQLRLMTPSTPPKPSTPPNTEGTDDPSWIYDR